MILAFSAPPSIAAGAGFYLYESGYYTTIIDNDPPSGAYTTSMRLSALVEVPEKLSADLPLGDVSFVSYTFDDGRNVLTESNSDATIRFATDSAGNVVDWLVSVVGGGFPGALGEQQLVIQMVRTGTATSTDFGGIAECVALTPACVFSEDSGQASTAPAAWTFVPEPNGLMLFATGLTVLAMRMRRARPC